MPWIFFLLGVSAQQPSWDVASIYQRALQVNPAASSALQKVSEAQAHVAEMIAQRRLQATLNGTASVSQGHLDDPLSNNTFHTLQGTLSVPFPNSGRIGAQVAQAEAQLRAAQAGVHRSRLDLGFRSNDAFFGVLRSRDAEHIAELNLEQAHRQVSDAQKRVAAGDIPAADVLKAQVPEAQAAVALARAKNALRISEYTLETLVQAPEPNLSSLSSMPALTPVAFSLEQAKAEARTNSPDIQEAQANVDAAEAAVRLSRHARDMDFSLQATEAHTTDPTTYSRLSTLGVTINLPLTDGGVARQQGVQAEAQLMQARSALALAQQSADMAVQQSYLDVEVDTANVQSTRETLRIAEESYAKAQQAYAAGLTTTRDVLDSGLTLMQARIDANSAAYDLAVARAKVDQAMGRELK